MGGRGVRFVGAMQRIGSVTALALVAFRVLSVFGMGPVETLNEDDN